MNRLSQLITVVSLVSVAGCMTTAERQEKQDELARTAPVCSGEADCNAKWEAAQLWIVHHAAYKIQTVTNVLIETYNPGPNEPAIAVRVTKEPQGGGKYKLLVNIWCNNMFGCTPNQWDAALDFNRSVGAVSP